MACTVSAMPISCADCRRPLHPAPFWVGLIKAPVFALLVASVACHRGLRVGRSAESIGRETTTSVVQSIFLVIVADAVFSVVFQVLGL